MRCAFLFCVKVVQHIWWYCSIFVLKVSKSVCILTTQSIMKLLKSKEAAAAVDIKSWPMVLDTGKLDTDVLVFMFSCYHQREFLLLKLSSSALVHPPDDLPRKKSPQMYKPPTPEMLAYLDFSVSTTGILAGVKVCWILKDTWVIRVLCLGVAVMFGC